ncbi:MAG: MlaE family ABC transporter permease [Sandaracinaceae bacterium]
MAAGDALLALPRLVGSAALGMGTDVGGMTLLSGRILARLLPPRLDRYELVRNLHRMGNQSVPIVVITAVFVGGIMVIQAAPSVERFNGVDIIGGMAGTTTVRELGPLLIALMFSGRVGAKNTAELGTMTVTDQIDALRALAIDPLAYLVVPRVVAMVIMLFVLTILGDLVALCGAVVVSEALIDVGPRTFWNSLIVFVEPWDVWTGLLKSIVFGVMIAVTSCHFGLSVKGGAPGVGRAVNAAVVAAASGVFVLDYFSTYLLK